MIEDHPPQRNHPLFSQNTSAPVSSVFKMNTMFDHKKSPHKKNTRYYI